MGTPITYKEAADILGVKVSVVRVSVHYGTLTKVPNRSYVQGVYREQVELFKGKPEISKRLLSPKEFKQWQDISQEAAATEREVPQGSPFSVAIFLAEKLKNTTPHATHGHTAYS